MAVGLQPEAPPLQCQAAQAGLVLATRLGLPARDLLAALLDGERGALLYDHFKPMLQPWVIFNAGECCQGLCTTMGEAESCSADQGNGQLYHSYVFAWIIREAGVSENVWCHRAKWDKFIPASGDLI